MKLLDNYFAQREEVFEYFDYIEDWCNFPIEDYRQYAWHLTDGDEDSAEVHYAKSKANLKTIVANDFNYAADGIDAGDYYADEIINPFLPKGVYRGKDYTMIVIDTKTDHNRFLAIFDNANEVVNDRH